MTMKINGLDIRPPTGPSPVASARVRTVDSNPQEQSKGGPQEFQVSHSARQMADLEARVMRSSGIDEAKVEAVRLALERGDYQIDAGKIADQLMRLDFEIGKASGRIK